MPPLTSPPTGFELVAADLREAARGTGAGSELRPLLDRAVLAITELDAERHELEMGLAELRAHLAAAGGKGSGGHPGDVGRDDEDGDETGDDERGDSRRGDSRDGDSRRGDSRRGHERGGGDHRAVIDAITGWLDALEPGQVDVLAPPAISRVFAEASLAADRVVAEAVARAEALIDFVAVSVADLLRLVDDERDRPEVASWHHRFTARSQALLTQLRLPATEPVADLIRLLGSVRPR